VGFHNNGLYNLDGNGAYPVDNTGLFDLTGERRDMGRFKAPTLRNVALTAPYMHDGSMATLEEVVEHYERGGRFIEDGEFTGDGRRSPYKSKFVPGFELSESERADLLAFLHSLTDESVVQDPRYSDPF
jgi:cytochrome c peroxidase